MTLQDLHVQNVEAAAEKIRASILPHRPRIAIILGSGLGGLADQLIDKRTVSYADLPGFPTLTVAGHAGEIAGGLLNDTPVLLFCGRKHFYETDDPLPLKTMIRSAQRAGVDTLFLSNAAGSLRPTMGISELMLIADHINLLGLHPLTGPNDEAFGPRFFSMTDAWDPSLRRILKQTAATHQLTLHEGVYAAFRGPSFETPAEIRMAQTLGADAVGMSSVPECLIARHCGLKVVGVSVLTNMGAGLSTEHLSHAHTLENAAHGAADFETLVKAAVKLL